MGDTATTPIRVITIEDDARFLASLDLLLNHADGFTLAGSFTAPADALAALTAFTEPAAWTGSDGRPAWDMVLMDLELPGMSGIECTRRIKALRPDVAVVVLTVFEDRTNLVEAICAGADGYLLKKTPADQLLQQLRSVVAGGSPLSAGVARTVVEIIRQIDRGAVRARPLPAVAIDFTPREREVLTCLVQGMSYKAVGRELDISIDTVRSYIRSVYRKLQVNNVAEAVGRVLRDGLV